MAKILTTTVGSLPRPEWMVPFLRGEQVPPPDWEEKLLEETKKVMKEQLDVGLDVINDGELARQDYVTTARKRLSGFDGETVAPSAGDLDEATEYSDAKFKNRKGLLTLTKNTEVKAAACSGPIAFTEEGLLDLKKEIDRVVKAAKELDVPLERVFFSSPSPGTLATFFGNVYYKHEDGTEDYNAFVQAIGQAMAAEYKAIQDAGLVLQLDCPDLGMGRHTKHKEKTLEQFQAVAKWHVKVMNDSLASLDASNIRMHVCWGNYPGPHDHDVPLKDIANIVLGAAPELVSVEACNPGHAHEHYVWGTPGINVPGRKTFLPGVLDTTTSHVEHPENVKQSLRQYVDALLQADANQKAQGAEPAAKRRRVMACTDCGFGTAAGASNVCRDIVFKKLRSMVKGARMLEQELEAEESAERVQGA